MAKAMKDDPAGWRARFKKAEDAFWQARRAGSSERVAIAAALDEAMADFAPINKQ